MKVNRFHRLFLENLRRQYLQDKDDLNLIEMFRQKLVTIQATGDHLPDAVIPEAPAYFFQCGEGRFGIAQPVHRIVAAIQNQSDLSLQPATQDFPDPADQSRPVCS